MDIIKTVNTLLNGMMVARVDIGTSATLLSIRAVKSTARSGMVMKHGRMMLSKRTPKLVQ